MSKIISAFCFLLSAFSAFAVQTNLLTFDTRDYGQYPQPSVRITLTLITPNPRTYSGLFIRQQPISKFTDTAGVGYFTNILWGTYRADIAGQPGTSFTLYVGTNTLGTVNAASLATNSAAVPPDDSLLYYSRAQVDALIASVESGGSASNVFFLNSPSITWSTTSGSNVAALATAVSNAWQNYTLAASNSITANTTNFVNGKMTSTSNALFAIISSPITNTIAKQEFFHTNTANLFRSNQFTFSGGGMSGQTGYAPGASYANNEYIIDFTLAVQGNPDFFTATNLFHHISLFATNQLATGHTPAGVAQNGGLQTAGYSYHTDFNLVELAFQHFRKTDHPFIFTNFQANLSNALNYVQKSNNIPSSFGTNGNLWDGWGLVEFGYNSYSAAHYKRCCDLMSIMAMRAGQPLVASNYFWQAQVIRSSMTNLFDETRGLLRTCSQGTTMRTTHSLAANALAVLYDAVDDRLKNRIEEEFVKYSGHNQGFFQYGALRTQPIGECLDSAIDSDCDGTDGTGTYQTGGYWPLTWGVEVVARRAPDLAEAMMNDLKVFNALTNKFYEWWNVSADLGITAINKGSSNYTSSAGGPATYLLTGKLTQKESELLSAAAAYSFPTLFAGNSTVAGAITGGTLSISGASVIKGLTFQDDDQYNIGAPGSGRPKHLYLAEDFVFGGTATGNGSGLSNAVDIIAGSNITVTTNANKRSFTIASTGGSAVTFNPNQFGSSSIGTNLLDGVLITNPVVKITTDTDHTLIQPTTGGTPFLTYNVSPDTLVFNRPPIADGSALTNLNASQLTTGTVPLARNDSSVLTNLSTRGFTNYAPNVISNAASAGSNTRLIMDGSRNGSTGSVLNYTSNNVSRFNVDSAGDVTVVSVTASGSLAGGGLVRAGIANPIYWNGGSQIQCVVNGKIHLATTAGADFDGLGFGVGMAGSSFTAAMQWASTNWPYLRVEQSTNNVMLGVRTGTNTATGKFAQLAAGALALPTNSISGAAVSPVLPFGGAMLWSDGTNLCVTLMNAGGILTTNKVTLSAYP